MRFRTSENTCCGNHNGSSAQRHVANIRAAAITMRFRTNENPCCANHNGSSAQSQWHPCWRLWTLRRHQRRQRGVLGTSGDNAAQQPLLEALGTAPAMRTASGTGDDARRSSFWRLWVLPRGQPAAPAATTRAAAPSVKALDTAPATRKTASGTSGDNARRSPFWRLWTLRPPRGRQQAAPAATTRAAAPSGGSGYCACQEDSQRRQRAPQPFLEALATAPATRKKASGTSGDNARRSPCLEALDAVPATRNVEMI